MRRKPLRSFDRKFVPLSTRFDHALLFAAQVHRDQDRKKSGIPYISHLLGVASIVLDYGGDEEMAIAALLHDAVEDHGGRPMLKVIEQIFGRARGQDRGRLHRFVRRRSRRRRRIGSGANSATCARVRHEDAETRFVSAADKLYNVRAVLRDLRYNGDSAFARFSAPKAKIIWYYRSLVNEYRAGGVTHLLKPLIDDLDRVVTEVEHLSGLLAASPKPHRRLTTKLKSKR